jgi:hypothetical protein
MAAASFGAPVSAREAASSATPPFAALPTAPALARGHVRTTLAGWGLGGIADDAEAIASEMTANAAAASVRPFRCGPTETCR